jgi:hypothetical protein
LGIDVKEFETLSSQSLSLFSAEESQTMPSQHFTTARHSIGVCPIKMQRTITTSVNMQDLTCHFHIAVECHGLFLSDF